jgi:hypothetical protein
MRTPWLCTASRTTRRMGWLGTVSETSKMTAGHTPPFFLVFLLYDSRASSFVDKRCAEQDLKEGGDGGVSPLSTNLRHSAPCVVKAIRSGTHVKIKCLGTTRKCRLPKTPLIDDTCTPMPLSDHPPPHTHAHTPPVPLPPSPPKSTLTIQPH